MTTHHPLHRVDATYAWGECVTPREPDRLNNSPTCNNTIKFGADHTFTVCPACGAQYRCSGNTFIRED